MKFEPPWWVPLTISAPASRSRIVLTCCPTPVTVLGLGCAGVGSGSGVGSAVGSGVSVAVGAGVEVSSAAGVSTFSGVADACAVVGSESAVSFSGSGSTEPSAVSAIRQPTTTIIALPNLPRRDQKLLEDPPGEFIRGPSSNQGQCSYSES
jgi:hypothetical protein